MFSLSITYISEHHSHFLSISYYVYHFFLINHYFNMKLSQYHSHNSIGRTRINPNIIKHYHHHHHHSLSLSSTSKSALSNSSSYSSLRDNNIIILIIINDCIQSIPENLTISTSYTIQIYLLITLYEHMYISLQNYSSIINYNPLSLFQSLN